MNDTSNVEHLSDFPREIYRTINLELSAQQIVDYAVASGEVAPCYTDPNDPDFQASPTFPSSLDGVPQLPKDFKTPPGFGMDAGRAVTQIAPIRPGVPLTGRMRIHDVYTKSGRSGRMTFVVTRLEIFYPDETLLATTDTGIVFRERPST